MAFKLTGDAYKEAPSLDGSILFDPSGRKRPMKEWVQVTYDHKSDWETFAKGALKYVKAM
jgi:hypothetical protein